MTRPALQLAALWAAARAAGAALIALARHLHTTTPKET